MSVSPPDKLHHRLRRFGQEFVSGLRRRDLERLFDRDAAEAFEVLSAGQRPAEEPGGELRRLLSRTRAFFLGLAFKLSPPRRLLFAFSLLCPLFGLATIDIEIGSYDLYIDASPLWFLASSAGLTFLLALELVDRLRVRDELEVARELQRELMPAGEPRIPGYQLVHSYRTANEIGGDYYDFFDLPDGRWVIAVGDASGHGIGAGLLMAIAGASLRSAIDLDPEPVAVLTFLDRVLSRTGGRRAFMTLFYAVLDPPSGTLLYGNAGHPFPLLRRSASGVEEIGEGGLPLGLRGEIGFTSSRVDLDPGDLLLLYSDGLAECLGETSGEAFGFDRVQELVAEGGGPRAVHQRILSAFDAHLGDKPPTDDVTLVVLDRGPAEPPESGEAPPSGAGARDDAPPRPRR